MSTNINTINTENPLVTVIVPVYNVEDYLRECLDSIIKQSLKKIEIICINDNSTDSSLDILKEYASKDNRIKLLNNSKNLGSSISRNKCLKEATGEYIIFNDADDKIDLDAYEKLYNYAKKHDEDFIVFDVKRFNDDGVVWKSILNSKSILGESYPKTNILEHKELIYDTTISNKFIKREFIENKEIKFLENILYEDLLFSMEIFCKSDNVGIYPKVKYYWRVRQNNTKSITQNLNNIKNLKDRIIIIKNILKLFSNEKYEELLEPFYIKLVEIDILQFINELDNCNEEYKNMMFGELKTLTKTIPKKSFCTINPIDNLKFDLFLKEDKDNLITLVHEDKLRKAKEKRKINELKEEKNKSKSQISAKNKEIKEEKEININLKNKNKKLKEININLKNKNKKLKDKNKNLKDELKTVKSTKGWIKYKKNNIYKRSLKKIKNKT